MILEIDKKVTIPAGACGCGICLRVAFEGLTGVTCNHVNANNDILETDGISFTAVYEYVMSCYNTYMPSNVCQTEEVKQSN